MIDLETMDGEISGRVIDVKNDPYDHNNMVFVIETEDGTREDVVVTTDEANRMLDDLEAN